MSDVAIRGRDGRPGRDGVRGPPGPPGLDGISIKGDPGPAGRDGRDVDPQEVKAAVERAVAQVPTLQGERGEPGPKGDKGDPGEPGPKGDKGDPGRDGKDFAPKPDQPFDMVLLRDEESGRIDGGLTARFRYEVAYVDGLPSHINAIPL